ncbi:MAG: hypothetical protein V2B18_18785 [Pseudomonadota bacterium]
MEARTFELGFAKFIERFHEQIRDSFVEDALLKRELLSQYELGNTMMEQLADSILSEFTKNIDKKTTVETIADRYVRLGLDCCEQGVSFSEMIRVFILLKRHIWLFFQESNFAGQPFDVRSIVALNNRMALFFDRAMYYFLVGFEQSQNDERSELEKFYGVLLEKLRRDLGLGGRFNPGMD